MTRDEYLDRVAEAWSNWRRTGSVAAERKLGELLRRARLTPVEMRKVKNAARAASHDPDLIPAEDPTRGGTRILHRY